MKSACVVAPALVLTIPVIALAQDAPQPTYPPGYDCASVPAGSQREACEQAQLSPGIDNDLNAGPPAEAGQDKTPGTVSPPTMPDQPDDEIRDGGRGAEGGAGGVGN